MLRGKFQVAGFMLLGLSGMMFILIHQPQTTIPSPLKDTTQTNPPQPPVQLPTLAQKTVATNPSQPLKPTGKPKSPAPKKLSVKRPSQVIDPKSLSKGTHLVIKLRDRRVYVYKNRKLKVSYPVGIGKAGWETPTGNYKVMDMQPHPVWEEPWTGKVILEGSNNPLGDRWIGFWTDGRNSIGFHGTPAEKLVGQAVSHGCVRMRNRDVVALYEQVKLGTPITVKP
jgi:lipoprotein-anchoring transpeptidase ErfK/SrfK